MSQKQNRAAGANKKSNRKQRQETGSQESSLEMSPDQIQPHMNNDQHQQLSQKQKLGQIFVGETHLRMQSSPQNNNNKNQGSLLRNMRSRLFLNEKKKFVSIPLNFLAPQVELQTRRFSLTETESLSKQEELFAAMQAVAAAKLAANTAPVQTSSLLSAAVLAQPKQESSFQAQNASSQPQSQAQLQVPSTPPQQQQQQHSTSTLPRRSQILAVKDLADYSGGGGVQQQLVLQLRARRKSCLCSECGTCGGKVARIDCVFPDTVVKWHRKQRKILARSKLKIFGRLLGPKRTTVENNGSRSSRHENSYLAQGGKAAQKITTNYHFPKNSIMMGGGKNKFVDSSDEFSAISYRSQASQRPDDGVMELALLSTRKNEVFVTTSAMKNEFPVQQSSQQLLLDGEAVSSTQIPFVSTEVPETKEPNENTESGAKILGGVFDSHVLTKSIWGIALQLRREKIKREKEKKAELEKRRREWILQKRAEQEARAKEKMLHNIQHMLHLSPHSVIPKYVESLQAKAREQAQNFPTPRNEAPDFYLPPKQLASGASTTSRRELYKSYRNVVPSLRLIPHSQPSLKSSRSAANSPSFLSAHILPFSIASATSINQGAFMASLSTKSSPRGKIQSHSQLHTPREGALPRITSLGPLHSSMEGGSQNNSALKQKRKKQANQGSNNSKINIPWSTFNSINHYGLAQKIAINYERP